MGDWVHLYYVVVMIGVVLFLGFYMWDMRAFYNRLRYKYWVFRKRLRGEIDDM